MSHSRKLITGEPSSTAFITIRGPAQQPRPICLLGPPCPLLRPGTGIHQIRHLLQNPSRTLCPRICAHQSGKGHRKKEERTWAALRRLMGVYGKWWVGAPAREGTALRPMHPYFSLYLFSMFTTPCATLKQPFPHSLSCFLVFQ